MKTLYESILDADTKIMNRADKKAATYLKRKKKIDLVLDAFEDLVIDWGLKFSHDADFGPNHSINSKKTIARYFNKRGKTNALKQEFMDGYRFLKDKFVSIWDECAPEENLLLNDPSASFVFKGLGIKVWISLQIIDWGGSKSTYNLFLMACFDQNDKYIEDVTNKLIKKIS